ncbi:MAG: polyprenyl synthetase family protein [Proteobacteria bacterium]|nr:polyprenyl synthetase family protein [Pseudomonadota bacterium]
MQSALKQVEDVSGSDPWDVPRTGLGGAVVVHVARGFGSRGWKRSGKLAVLAVEAYNQRVFLGVPEGADRDALLERDVGRLHRVWSDLLKRDGALVGRVLDRMFASSPSVGDDQVPEAVLFLRGAVAAGVVAGDVPDPVHALLDRHATWLGLAWEAAGGSLDPAGWTGALRAVGLSDGAAPDQFGAVARQQASASLAPLPQGTAAELFESILGHLAPEQASVREPAAWEPHLAPEPSPLHRRPFADGTPLGEFRDRWIDAIEVSIQELASTDSAILARAVRYLHAQGGKRVRPLMVLAAAQAASGDPQRALAAGAAVEWLHQGSLVIDDMVDRAALRRGGATLHTATSVPFAAGVAAFVFARIHRALRGMHPAIRDHLVDAAAALAEGERQELHHTGDLSLDATGYYRIIEAKTARLFAAAAAAGALSVEAPKSTAKALARYGREAGLAFQIIDDVLDYTGDERTLGKVPGTDLRAGKITLPVLLLLDRVPESDRDRLVMLLGRDHAEDHLGWVRARIAEHDVDVDCIARAREHLIRARKAIAGLPGDEGRARLEELAGRFVERQR